MRLIRQQSAADRVNVVVATHSMNLIDGVDIHDVVLLRLDDDRRTVMERLGSGTHADFDRHLGIMAAAVGLRNSVLLHERCFLAVEGESEQLAIPILFNLSEDLSPQAAGVALWACGNNEGALHLARYLFKHGRSVLLMVDADSESTNKMFRTDRLKATFDNRDEEVVVMLGKEHGHRELEELFSDELWARTANTVWPRDHDWTPEDFKALRDGKFSADVLEMLREHSEDAPRGKPAMMLGLAAQLDKPEEVPKALRDVFRRLRELAG